MDDWIEAVINGLLVPFADFIDSRKYPRLWAVLILLGSIELIALGIIGAS